MTENNNKKRHRDFIRISLAVLLLIFMGSGAFAYWYLFMRGIVFSDDARFGGDLVDIAPQISGTIEEIRFLEGDKVKKGQILFVLEKKALFEALARTEAEVKSAEADLLIAKAQDEKALTGFRPEEIQMAEAVERKAAAALKLAADDYRRFEALYKGQVVPTSKLDQVKTIYEEAKRAHEEALHHLTLVKRGSRKEDVASSGANVKMKEARLTVAKASLRQAKVNLNYTEVRSPCDGVIVRKWASVGSMVPMGKSVYTIFNPSTLNVNANIEEKQLEKITIGDAVDISVDAYPDVKLTGRVDKITPTANSEFSLIPSEGVSGTYIKIAQRVQVRISVDHIPSDLNVGPGLSVEVAIHLSKKSGITNG